MNRSVREVKCKRALSGPEDWILRYVRTCLFFVKMSVRVSAGLKMSVRVDSGFTEMIMGVDDARFKDKCVGVSAEFNE